MKKSNFAITADPQGFGEGIVERHGARAAEIRAGTHIRFRLYDGDDELYFEGVAVDEIFDPLDWARAYAGATRIDYQQGDGSWSTL